MHLKAALHILRYLKHTINYYISYHKDLISNTPQFVGYADASHGNDFDNGKLTISWVFMINNSPISWCS
jgi:hypothetical protein